ncbi:MAG TPA: GNAT family N-acetyltransferase [Solirubrobacteraceae bacterium]|jgi:RimJ/RimL family protein N-acetyltransferase|nr:GNAT family N-acetyltransferase [Solirubrobacteraceae bacterium]
MSFYVRPVLSGDWEQLRDLRLLALSTDPDAFGSTYEEARSATDAEWRKRAADSERGAQSRWLAAVDESGGWIGIAVAHGDGRDVDANLFGMWVAPAARGSGVAAALCDACSGWAGEHGFAGIVLGAFADNERAIAAYRKAGFMEYGGISEQRADRVFDVVLMRRST